ncbi:MAG: PA2779 family protein [Gammaproteobacteria bacterium]|nr:PA2779 family protein [Gammaproteobacteria bacterium]
MLIAKLTRCLLIALAAFAVSLPSQAAMVGTAQMQSSQLSIDLGSIAAKRDWIEEQLVVGGVEAKDAASRVAAMTDVQVAQIHQRIDESPAGGADALVVIILVLVITELMGYTDIIPNWPASE